LPSRPLLTNKNYVRDRKGNEVIEEIEEQVKEWEGGTPVYRHQTTRRKVVDDNTIQIAQEFRRWLSEQD
jgi:type I restriction enzyme M protein